LIFFENVDLICTTTQLVSKWARYYDSSFESFFESWTFAPQEMWKGGLMCISRWSPYNLGTCL